MVFTRAFGLRLRGMEEAKLLSVQEVATELRLSVETVRRYIRSGEFEVAKIGRQYLVKPESVKAFVAKQFKSRENGDGRRGEV